jgi:cyclopropane fatty-acyl-phospholipid synthase-like methyltransferase
VSLFFRGAYLFGWKPWDSGVPPPELVSFVGEHPPGKALDLGCGTGTNCIFLAQHGWDVTGVDFVPRAVQAAKNKAKAAAVAPRFVVGDVTRLAKAGVGDGYDLLLDLGCFHSIPEAGRDGYVRGATSAAAAGATMLMFCVIRRQRKSLIGPPGVDPGEIQARFESAWSIAGEQAGRPITGYDASWYTLRRK